MSPRGTVLVVDDEPVVRDAAARVCRGEGFAVDCADSAAQARALLARGRYALVLCDLMMPEEDGFSLLAFLASAGWPSPAAVMTGYSTVDAAVRALGEGAVDFVPKPFTVDELGAAVRRAAAAGALRAAAGPAFVPTPSRFQRLDGISWASLEPEGTALVGVCDLFVRSVGGLAAAALGIEGAELEQGRPCAELSGPDGVRHPLLAPLSGRVLAVNAAAAERPSLVEKDPYFAGWLYRIVPSELEAEAARLSGFGAQREWAQGRTL
ncbi:response regulator [bacterium]|nr:MAG: response regulator [bacterium]